MKSLLRRTAVQNEPKFVTAKLKPTMFDGSGGASAAFAITVSQEHEVVQTT